MPAPGTSTANEDVRLKVCIHDTTDDFVTVHHELGHIYYFLAYRKQPFLFRNGANDGFHEAIGDAIALSITPEYLQEDRPDQTASRRPQPTCRCCCAPRWTRSPSCPSAC